MQHTLFASWISNRHMLDEIQQNNRIDVFTILFKCQMQVWSCAFSAIACDCNSCTGTDKHTFVYCDFGKVTVTYCEVAMTESDI